MVYFHVYALTRYQMMIHILENITEETTLLKDIEEPAYVVYCRLKTYISTDKSQDSA